MTLALIALAVLAVVVFAFVLEPIVRARSDRTVLDAVALPDHEQPLAGDEEPSAETGDQPIGASEERSGGHRVTIDQPAGSDAS